MRAFEPKNEARDSSANELIDWLRHALSRIPVEQIDSAGKTYLANARDIARQIAFRQNIAPSDPPAPSDGAGQLDLGRFLFASHKQWVNRAKMLGSVFALLLTEDLPASVPANQVLLEAALSNLLHYGFTDGQHRHIQLSVTAGDGAWLFFTLQGDGRSFPLTEAITLAEAEDPALMRARQACEAMGARLDLRCVRGVRAEARCAVPLRAMTESGVWAV